MIYNNNYEGHAHLEVLVYYPQKQNKSSCARLRSFLMIGSWYSCCCCFIGTPFQFCTMSGLRDQLAKDLDNTLKSLQDAVQATSDLFLNLPEAMSDGKLQEDIAAARVVEFRSQISSIRTVIARRHLKVAFFGRTSCGKSTVINALLGQQILPTGLGHTTTKFVHVQGTDTPTPYLQDKNNDEVQMQLDNNGESISFEHINLLCKLLRHMLLYKSFST